MTAKRASPLGPAQMVYFRHFDSWTGQYPQQPEIDSGVHKRSTSNAPNWRGVETGCVAVHETFDL